MNRGAIGLMVMETAIGGLYNRKIKLLKSWTFSASVVVPHSSAYIFD